MTIKCLMVTGSNEDPRQNDDWWSSEILETGKDYTREELIAIAKCDDDDAIWAYEGEEWEDKRAYRPDRRIIQFADKFYPWDRPECLKIVREATTCDNDDDEFMQSWQREQAMEAGMMGGCLAYNEVMGY